MKRCVFDIFEASATAPGADVTSAHGFLDSYTIGVLARPARSASCKNCLLSPFEILFQFVEIVKGIQFLFRKVNKRLSRPGASHSLYYICR